jgi:biopolymer transport protein ExbB
MAYRFADFPEVPSPVQPELAVKGFTAMRFANLKPGMATRITPVALLTGLASVSSSIADEIPQAPPLQDLVIRDAQQLATKFQAIYQQTPWTDRVAWGALTACAVLAIITILERTWALRSRRIMPKRFLNRLEERLEDGRLDRSKLLDLCEMNASAAARVAVAVVSRWGRPTADLERALAGAVRLESEELRRNVPTLRRVAVLAPMLGLLGSLLMIGRLLQQHDPQAVQQAWTGLLAQGLLPLTGGVLIAVLALISYDGLSVRVSKYTSRLEMLGAKLVDQIALATPPAEHRIMLESPNLPRPHLNNSPRRDKPRDRDDYEDSRHRNSRRRKPLEPIDLDELDD